MKHDGSRAFGRVQTGFSLVELMVSVAIALVLMIALMQLLLGTMQVDRTTSDIARMQESGRNALELIGRAIRQAGARSNVNALFAGTAVNGTKGLNGAPDTITLQYEAQDLGEMSCTGAPAAAGTMMTYLFAVNAAASPPTLTCNGTVVVDNIESIQISYGIDASKSGSIASYTSSPTAVEFGQVAAVRIVLVVKGPSSNIAVGVDAAGSATKSQSYIMIGEGGTSDTVVTTTDGFLRQVYRATFTVRNQAG